MLKRIYNAFCRLIYVLEGCINCLLFHIFGVVINGKPIAIRGILTIRSCRKGSIILGKSITINSGKRYNIIGNDYRTVLRTIQNGRIEIGDNVGISNSAIVSAVEIKIDDDVMIGGNCQIMDTDFHPISYQERILGDFEGGLSQPVHIKKGAFIGANSIILKGVSVGEGAVVGAASVVTRNIPDGECWGGNPIKFIKKV